MSQYLKNNQGIVQFYKHNCNCYAVYTLYINKQTQYEKLFTYSGAYPFNFRWRILSQNRVK